MQDQVRRIEERLAPLPGCGFRSRGFRWSSASGATGVIAKNEAARTPPDRITAKDASRQGCRIRCDESRNAWHPCRGAVFVRAVSGGVRAVTFFATTPASREALDHRLSA